MKIKNNKWNVGDVVAVNGIIYEVICIIDRCYDLHEVYGNNFKRCVLENEIEDVYINEAGEYMPISLKNKQKKTYPVHYSFYLSDCIDIEANSEKEAEMICQQMIERGEIGNLNEMYVGDSEIWVD